MKKSYYVNTNAQSNGNHEVHNENCAWLPAKENRIYLGEHDSCDSALRKARIYYKEVDGCSYCSPSCHKQ